MKRIVFTTCMLVFTLLAVGLVSGCTETQQIPSTTTTTTSTSTTSISTSTTTTTSTSLSTSTTSTTTTTSAGGSSSYFPNTVGYTWVYAVSDGTTGITTAGGNVLLPGDITAQEWVITQISTIDGNSVLRSYNTLSSSAVINWGTSLEGYEVVTNEGYTDLEFPLVVGNTWTRYSSGNTTINASVEAKESFTVPLDTYSNCYKITFYTYVNSILSSTAYNWYANNVGLIRQSSTTTATKELSSKSF